VPALEGWIAAFDTAIREAQRVDGELGGDTAFGALSTQPSTWAREGGPRDGGPTTL
jgi:hypothetical protein